MESRKVLHFVVQVSWIPAVRTRSSHEDLSNRCASSGTVIGRGAVAAGEWIFTGKKNGRKMSSVKLGDVFSDTTMGFITINFLPFKGNLFLFFFSKHLT